MFLGSFAGLKLASACHALLLARGKFSHFRSFPFLFVFRSTTPLLCKLPLLLLGFIGPRATLLEFEEGLVASPIQKLQNIYKHHLFHLENRVRYQCDSTLDQVGVVLGRKLNPGNVSVLILLG